MTGLLVAIDGPKFVGKTTLMNQLRLELGTAVSTWIFTKEPTEQFDLGNEQRFVGKDLAALIAADRARHLADVIEPALDAGRMVVTDRYVLSSYVFHCLDGVSTSAIADLNASFRPPDVLVILQCSPGTLLARRVAHGRATRLSNALSVEDELLGYLTYADCCRPVNDEIIIGYNETMKDCQLIAKRLIASVESLRGARA